MTFTVHQFTSRERSARGLDVLDAGPGIGRLKSTKGLDQCTFSFAMFRGFKGTIPHREHIGADWGEVVEEVIGDQPTVGENKNEMPYFVPAELREAEFVGETRAAAIKAGRSTFGKMRSASHVMSGTFLPFDLDDIAAEEWLRFRARLRQEGLAYAAFSTFQHGVNSDLVRVRVLLPLDRAVSPDEFKGSWAELNRAVFEGRGDPASNKPCQAAGVWMAHPERRDKAFKEIHDGAPLSAGALLAGAGAGSFEDAPRPSHLRLVTSARSLNHELMAGIVPHYELPAEIPAGRRNPELLSYAGALRAKGFSEPQILELVWEANRERCRPPLDDDEVSDLVGRYSAREGRDAAALSGAACGNPSEEEATTGDDGQAGGRAPEAGKTNDAAQARAAVNAVGSVSIDQNGVPRLLCSVGNRHEALDLCGGDARDILISQVFRITGKTIGKDTLDREIALLRARAKTEFRTCKTAVRVAEHGGCYYLDLNNARGEAVRIGAGGWELVANPAGVHFLRDNKTGELPVPESADMLLRV